MPVNKLFFSVMLNAFIERSSEGPDTSTSPVLPPLVRHRTTPAVRPALTINNRTRNRIAKTKYYLTGAEYYRRRILDVCYIYCTFQSSAIPGEYHHRFMTFSSVSRFYFHDVQKLTVTPTAMCFFSNNQSQL